MQAIKDWIRANPEQGRALMRENVSYIFFRELTRTRTRSVRSTSR